MNLKTETKIETKILSRVKVLYYVIYELAEAFGVSEDALESITKGVLERPIIKEIFIDYYSEDSIEKPFLRIKFTIDWEKHSVLATTEEGQAFRVSTEKSIHSQISEASDYIIKHVEQIKKTYTKIITKTHYRYVDSITSDEKKFREAMEFLGHILGRVPDLDENEEFTKKLAQEFKQLPELQLSVMSKG